MTNENPPYDALDEANRLFAIAVTCEAEELLKRLKPEWEPGQPLNDDRAARDILVLAIATVLRRNPTNQHAWQISVELEKIADDLSDLRDGRINELMKPGKKYGRGQISSTTEAVKYRQNIVAIMDAIRKVHGLPPYQTHKLMATWLDETGVKPGADRNYVKSFEYNYRKTNWDEKIPPEFDFEIIMQAQNWMELAREMVRECGKHAKK